MQPSTFTLRRFLVWYPTIVQSKEIHETILAVHKIAANFIKKVCFRFRENFFSWKLKKRFIDFLFSLHNDRIGYKKQHIWPKMRFYSNNTCFWVIKYEPLSLTVTIRCRVNKLCTKNTVISLFCQSIKYQFYTINIF